MDNKENITQLQNTPPPPAPLKQTVKEPSAGSASKSVLQYTNHMLATLGFRPLKSQKDSSGVMDTLLTVLHSFQQNKIYYGDLEQRIAVLQTEHDHALANLEKKNNKLELCEREADDLRAKLSSTYSSLNEYKEEARVAKEEASTLKAGFAYYKNQYSHEIRKRDNEMQKLKQSYQKAVSSSSSSGGLKVVMINGRMPARSYKKTPENAHDDFQKLVSDEKDTRIQELTDEILQLKTCLYDIYARVKLLLSKIGSSSGSITKEQIYLPFEMIQEEIQEEMLHLIEELESVETVLNNQTEQLDELNTVINDQQKVIKDMAELEGRGAVASKEEEESVKKLKKSLVEEEERLKQIKAKLEEDRRQFTEAAIRLGRERAALESEKEHLEQEKRSVETQHLLKALPNTPTWLKESFARVKELKENYKTPMKPENFGKEYVKSSTPGFDASALQPFKTPDNNTQNTKFSTPSSIDRLLKPSK